MGKTALALNIAEHVGSTYGMPVAVFSMEMSGEQLAMRMIGSIARVDQHKMRTGSVEEDDWSQRDRAAWASCRTPTSTSTTAER